MIVVDNSVLCSWFLPDESNAFADAAFDEVQEFGAIAPGLLIYEFLNVLAICERRKRIDAKQSNEICQAFFETPVDIVALSQSDLATNVLPVAKRHSLTAYDATYLYLATKYGFPLATLDQKLANASKSEGVDLFFEPNKVTIQ